MEDYSYLIGTEMGVLNNEGEEYKTITITKIKTNDNGNTYVFDENDNVYSFDDLNFKYCLSEKGCFFCSLMDIVDGDDYIIDAYDYFNYLAYKNDFFRSDEKIVYTKNIQYKTDENLTFFGCFNAAIKEFDFKLSRKEIEDAYNHFISLMKRQGYINEDNE